MDTRSHEDGNPLSSFSPEFSTPSCRSSNKVKTSSSSSQDQSVDLITSSSSLSSKPSSSSCTYTANLPEEKSPISSSSSFLSSESPFYRKPRATSSSSSSSSTSSFLPSSLTVEEEKKISVSFPHESLITNGLSSFSYHPSSSLSSDHLSLPSVARSEEEGYEAKSSYSASRASILLHIRSVKTHLSQGVEEAPIPHVGRIEERGKREEEAKGQYGERGFHYEVYPSSHQHRRDSNRHDDDNRRVLLDEGAPHRRFEGTGVSTKSFSLSTEAGPPLLSMSNYISAEQRKYGIPGGEIFSKQNLRSSSIDPSPSECSYTRKKEGSISTREASKGSSSSLPFTPVVHPSHRPSPPPPPPPPSQGLTSDNGVVSALSVPTSSLIPSSPSFPSSVSSLHPSSACASHFPPKTLFTPGYDPRDSIASSCSSSRLSTETGPTVRWSVCTPGRGGEEEGKEDAKHDNDENKTFQVICEGDVGVYERNGSHQAGGLGEENDIKSLPSSFSSSHVSRDFHALTGDGRKSERAIHTDTAISSSSPSVLSLSSHSTVTPTPPVTSIVSSSSSPSLPHSSCPSGPSPSSFLPASPPSSISSSSSSAVSSRQDQDGPSDKSCTYTKELISPTAVKPPPSYEEKRELSPSPSFSSSSLSSADLKKEREDGKRESEEERLGKSSFLQQLYPTEKKKEKEIPSPSISFGPEKDRRSLSSSEISLTTKKEGQVAKEEEKEDHILLRGKGTSLSPFPCDLVHLLHSKKGHEQEKHADASRALFHSHQKEPHSVEIMKAEEEKTSSSSSSFSSSHRRLRERSSSRSSTSATRGCEKKAKRKTQQIPLREILSSASSLRNLNDPGEKGTPLSSSLSLREEREKQASSLAYNDGDDKDREVQERTRPSSRMERKVSEREEEEKNERRDEKRTLSLMREKKIDLSPHVTSRTADALFPPSSGVKDGGDGETRIAQMRDITKPSSSSSGRISSSSSSSMVSSGVIEKKKKNPSSLDERDEVRISSSKDRDLQHQGNDGKKEKEGEEGRRDDRRLLPPCLEREDQETIKKRRTSQSMSKDRVVMATVQKDQKGDEKEEDDKGKEDQEEGGTLSSSSSSSSSRVSTATPERQMREQREEEEESITSLHTSPSPCSSSSSSDAKESDKDREKGSVRIFCPSLSSCKKDEISSLSTSAKLSLSSSSSSTQGGSSSSSRGHTPTSSPLSSSASSSSSSASSSSTSSSSPSSQGRVGVMLPPESSSTRRLRCPSLTKCVSSSSSSSEKNDPQAGRPTCLRFFSSSSSSSCPSAVSSGPTPSSHPPSIFTPSVLTSHLPSSSSSSSLPSSQRLESTQSRGGSVVLPSACMVTPLCNPSGYLLHSPHLHETPHAKQSRIVSPTKQFLIRRCGADTRTTTYLSSSPSSPSSSSSSHRHYPYVFHGEGPPFLHPSSSSSSSLYDHYVSSSALSQQPLHSLHDSRHRGGGEGIYVLPGSYSTASTTFFPSYPRSLSPSRRCMPTGEREKIAVICREEERRRDVLGEGEEEQRRRSQQEVKDDRRPVIFSSTTTTSSSSSFSSFLFPTSFQVVAESRSSYEESCGRSDQGGGILTAGREKEERREKKEMRVIGYMLLLLLLLCLIRRIFFLPWTGVTPSSSSLPLPSSPSHHLLLSSLSEQLSSSASPGMGPSSWDEERLRQVLQALTSSSSSGNLSSSTSSSLSLPGSSPERNEYLTSFFTFMQRLLLRFSRTPRGESLGTMATSYTSTRGREEQEERKRRGEGVGESSLYGRESDGRSRGHLDEATSDGWLGLLKKFMYEGEEERTGLENASSSFSRQEKEDREEKEDLLRSLWRSIAGREEADGQTGSDSSLSSSSSSPAVFSLFINANEGREQEKEREEEESQYGRGTGEEKKRVQSKAKEKKKGEEYWHYRSWRSRTPKKSPFAAILGILLFILSC
ncbi:hypothetical protein CSUI_006059, partial [Cystoisospora suis]